MGRRKIEIEPLTDDRNRTVTFVKRKAGLFKKAHELLVLCQVDLAVIIIGNHNRVYEYSSVDTKELIQAYGKVLRVLESKGPEHYGNYKKKRHVHSAATDASDDASAAADSDSDTPEPKRPKRSYDTMARLSRPPPPLHILLNNVPTFATTQALPAAATAAAADHMRKNSATLNQRPVLRVQIPIDAKANAADSAQTLTAAELARTGDKENAADEPKARLAVPLAGARADAAAAAPNINTPKFSSFGTFKLPDARKPVLPFPITSKLLTSSPSSATAPPLPNGAYGQAPTVQYQQYQQQQQQQQQQYQYQQQLQQQLQRQGAHVVPPGNPLGDPAAYYKMRLSLPHNGHGDTPTSGLPSRYLSDIFPLPSTFYAPQDWPTTAVGLTPLHNSMPQYFGGMPSARPGGGWPLPQPQPPQPPPPQPQLQLQLQLQPPQSQSQPQLQPPAEPYPTGYQPSPPSKERTTR